MNFSVKDLYCIEPIMPKDMVHGQPYMIAYNGPNKEDLFKDGRKAFTYHNFVCTTDKYIVFKSIDDTYKSVSYYPLNNHFFVYVDYPGLAKMRTTQIRSELVARATNVC